MEGRLPGCDEARLRPIPRLDMVLAGRADAIREPMLGTEAAEAVESVGEGASEPEVVDDFPLR